MDAEWLNAPIVGSITAAGVSLDTEPHTDFWQRTFYGFRASNAPAALVEVPENVTFSVRVRASYQRRYDQAGIIVWIDELNWFKASIEFEGASCGRLGSVLTTDGHSDWATRDVSVVPQVWWQLSRRGPDFLLQAKLHDQWEQLRMFHVAALGPTQGQWGQLPASDVPASPVRMGVYACSPEDSSFSVWFDQMTMERSSWAAHV